MDDIATTASHSHSSSRIHPVIYDARRGAVPRLLTYYIAIHYAHYYTTVRSAADNNKYEGWWVNTKTLKGISS